MRKIALMSSAKRPTSMRLRIEGAKTLTFIAVTTAVANRSLDYDLSSKATAFVFVSFVRVAQIMSLVG